MLNKKVLIFSNNALSKSNSNGRTLLNFFSEDDKPFLAQFFLQNDEPDFAVCENYFFASDKDVLKSVLKHRSAGKIIEKTAKTENGKNISVQSKKIPRNPLTMIIRNFFWNQKCWRKGFYEWIYKFSPECILLQAGDAPFLYNIALDVAKKINIPLMIYNSEDYYFKNYNYFRDSKATGMLYPLFRAKLKKSIKKVMAYANISVYISEDLKATYDAEFGKPSVAIYTATDIEPVVKTDKKPIFSYLGNLGVDRHIGLVKIANTLNSINPDYKLDVYGKIPNERVSSAFAECEALNYIGLVSYDKVKEVISESLLVFHTESTDTFYCKDIKHGFSTKIADSLASGTCFVIFAPEMLSCTKYIKNNNCGCVITEEDELKNSLKKIIEDEELRDLYIKNALKIVEKNHNSLKNKEKMAEIINSL